MANPIPKRGREPDPAKMNTGRALLRAALAIQYFRHRHTGRGRRSWRRGNYGGPSAESILNRHLGETPAGVSDPWFALARRALDLSRVHGRDTLIGMERSGAAGFVYSDQRGAA